MSTCSDLINKYKIIVKEASLFYLQTINDKRIKES